MAVEKDKICLNCGYTLDEQSVYCSNCGQKVDDNNLKFKAVMHEFFDNYLSFDTRIVRSIVPFLFKPGELTKAFISGKRKHYVNPFRLYLVMSLLFFFLLGMIINRNTNGESIISEREEGSQSELLKGISKGLEGQQDSLEYSDTADLIDTIVQLEGEEPLKKNALKEVNHRDSLSKPESTQPRVQLSNNTSQVSFKVGNLSKIEKYRYDRSYTDEQLLDSLTTSDSLSSYWHFIGMQTVRMYRADGRSAMKFIIGNYSISMFFLIPAMALLLMLFFWKNKLPFVAHLIHSLQLHSFAFFIYSVAFSASLLIDNGVSLSIYLLPAFVISAIYIYFSCKQLYVRTYLSSFFRVVFFGFVYYLVWAAIIILGLIISFLLY